MRQVAERAGVSAKTVSRVMNNDRYVSADVRQRVERAIEELQYVPNLLARTFRSGRHPAIGVAVPDISDPFFAAVTHAIEQIARTHGTAVFVTSLGNESHDEQTGVEALLGRQIIGLISTPVAADQSYLKPWQARTAMVFIDRMPSKITADSVIEDDRGGAHNATTHLIDHGHLRIAFIGDRPSISTTSRRLDGYRAALRDAGIEEDPELITLGVTSSAEAAEATVKLLALPGAPTAIFSSNTKCSIGVVPALQGIGRSEVALVSFGDVPLAAALRPALTVVDQNPDALGRFAATRLFELVDNPSRRRRRNTVLPVTLVARASSHGAAATNFHDRYTA